MKVFGQHESNTIDQLVEVDKSAVRTALCADGHLGYIMPVGGVAAYRNKVSVTGVGYDIACGNAAILSDKTNDYDQRELIEIANEIANTISFGVGRKNNANDAPTDNPLFESSAWENIPQEFREDLKGKARKQLGTVGSGNHYVDLFSDEDNKIWIGVHFGSRGFGHTVASGFLSLYQWKKWGERVPESETILDLDTELGKAYWSLMSLAGVYAYAGREWVARKVLSIIDGKELKLVHNHHNFAWKENHFGEELVIVRKGATPAFPDQEGFVGGSMGDDAVILKGINPSLPDDISDQKESMYSTVHGAGRVMSRTKAAGKYRRGKQISKGLISQEMMNSWIKEKNVILRGGGIDESPHAYRRLPDVLKAHQGTIEILHALKPLIVVMASNNEFDPYKD